MNTHRQQHRPRPFTTAEEDQKPAAERVFDAAEPEAEEPIAEPQDQGPQPTHTWESIDTAPRNGQDVIVRWGEDDTEGRVVRWKNGRHFNGRRWEDGGRWSPSDSMMPPPAEGPSEWARPVDYQESEPESQTEAA